MTTSTRCFVNSNRSRKMEVRVRLKMETKQQVRAFWIITLCLTLNVVQPKSYAQTDTITLRKNLVQQLDIWVNPDRVFADLGLAFRHPENVESLHIINTDSNAYYLLDRPELSFAVFTNLKALSFSSFGGIEIINQLNRVLREQSSNSNLKSIHTNGPIDFPIMTYVEYCTLSNNINPENAVKFPNVRYLQIQGYYTYLPIGIGQLSKLEDFVFASDSIKVLPEELCQLTNLRTLDLQTEALELLPKSFGKLINLYDFYTTSEKLRLVPLGLGQLKRLHYFYAGNATFDQFPEELFQLDSLEQVSFSVKKIKDKKYFVSGFCKMQYLSVLEIGCPGLSKRASRRMFNQLSECLPHTKISLNLIRTGY